MLTAAGRWCGTLRGDGIVQATLHVLVTQLVNELLRNLDPERIAEIVNQEYRATCGAGMQVRASAGVLFAWLISLYQDVGPCQPCTCSTCVPACSATMPELMMPELKHPAGSSWRQWLAACDACMPAGHW
jgi:hypothetical protein